MVKLRRRRRRRKRREEMQKVEKWYDVEDAKPLCPHSSELLNSKGITIDGTNCENQLINGVVNISNDDIENVEHVDYIVRHGESYGTIV